MHLRDALHLDRWIQLFLVFIAVVCVNLLSARHFLRVDITQARVHSLDSATVALVSDLERPLIVKVFFTGDLEAEYADHERILVDKLEELRAYSGGLMEISVRDPTGYKELEEEAQRFGVQRIQFQFRQEDRLEVRPVYMGASFVYGDRQEVLPAITRVDTLEYELARTLRTLVNNPEPPIIGFATSFGEVNPLTGSSGPLRALVERIGDRFQLAPVTLGGPGPLPETLDALMIIGPQQTYSERALYQLDQFVMRGGGLAVFVANHKPDLRSMRISPLYSGLEGLLAQYGVSVQRDLVVDRKQNGKIRLPVRRGKAVITMPVNYPLIPSLTDLSREHPIVRDLHEMLSPFTSSLEVIDPLPAGVEASVLASASATAGRIRGAVSADPLAYRVLAPGERTGPCPVAVAMTGSFRSLFADKAIPPAPEETVSAEDVAIDDPASKISDGAPARIVVVGSADMVANNATFVSNLADWLVQDTSLIRIRSRSLQLPRMNRPEARRVHLLKALNALVPSGVLLLLGGGIWFRRRPKAMK
jgi:ABC-2 type transport system permease protein